jgi:hypothetical protein
LRRRCSRNRMHGGSSKRRWMSWPARPWPSPSTTLRTRISPPLVPLSSGAARRSRGPFFHGGQDARPAGNSEQRSLRRGRSGRGGMLRVRRRRACAYRPIGCCRSLADRRARAGRAGIPGHGRCRVLGRIQPRGHARSAMEFVERRCRHGVGNRQRVCRRQPPGSTSCSIRSCSRYQAPSAHPSPATLVHRKHVRQCHGTVGASGWYRQPLAELEQRDIHARGDSSGYLELPHHDRARRSSNDGYADRERHVALSGVVVRYPLFVIRFTVHEQRYEPRITDNEQRQFLVALTFGAVKVGSASIATT